MTSMKEVVLEWIQGSARSDLRIDGETALALTSDDFEAWLADSHGEDVRELTIRCLENRTEQWLFEHARRHPGMRG